MKSVTVEEIDRPSGRSAPRVSRAYLSCEIQDRYNTSRALPGARRHPAGPHRRPAPAAPLASEAELGREYGVSRVTVRRALELLRDEGLVTARQGVGWFVAVDPVRQSLGRVTTVEAALEAAGAASGRRVLEFAFETAPADVAKTLGLPADGEVLRVTRLNLADGEPFASVTVWVAGEPRCPAQPADVERSTFYDLLPLQGVEPGRVRADDHRDRGRAARPPSSSVSPSARRSWPAGGSPTIATETRSSSPSTATRPTSPRSKSNSPLRRPREPVMAEIVEPFTPHLARARRVRAVPRAPRDHPRATRPPADLRREGGVRPRGRPRDDRARAGRGLRRLPPRPRRDAGRDRADGAAAVHAGQAADRRGADHRALRPPDPGPRRRGHRPQDRARHELRGLRVPALGRARSTASASGSRAPGSSTRSCSSSTRSRAG